MTPADDLRAPAALADPHPFFRRLRAHDPVHWSEASHAWLLTSHAEVSAALRDDVRLSSDRLSPLEARMPEGERHALAGLFELLRGWMVFRDPPDHERMRDPVRKVFTPPARWTRSHRVSDRSSPSCSTSCRPAGAATWSMRSPSRSRRS